MSLILILTLSIVSNTSILNQSLLLRVNFNEKIKDLAPTTLKHILEIYIRKSLLFVKLRLIEKKIKCKQLAISEKAFKTN